MHQRCLCRQGFSQHSRFDWCARKSDYDPNQPSLPALSPPFTLPAGSQGHRHRSGGTSSHDAQHIQHTAPTEARPAGKGINFKDDSHLLRSRDAPTGRRLVGGQQRPRRGRDAVSFFADSPAAGAAGLQRRPGRCGRSSSCAERLAARGLRVRTRSIHLGQAQDRGSRFSTVRRYHHRREAQATAALHP